MRRTDMATARYITPPPLSHTFSFTNTSFGIGWANNRHVQTTYAMQHNLGLGGAVVVTVYRRADGKAAPKVDSQAVGKANKLGYNPAVEARGFTAQQAAAVRSRNHKSEWALQDTAEKVEARF